MSFTNLMASSKLVCSASPSLLASPFNNNFGPANVTPNLRRGSSIGGTNLVFGGTQVKVYREPLKTFASASASSAESQDRDEVKKDLARNPESVLQRQRQENGRGTATRALSPFDLVFPTSRTLMSLLDTVDRIFDEPYYTPARLSRALEETMPSRNSIRTPWDVIEEEEAFFLRLDIPGFSKEQVKVSVDEGNLVIKAEQNMEETSDKFRARNSSNISSKLLLPDNVELENISAELKNGVLLVTVPKKTKKSNGVMNVHVN